MRDVAAATPPAGVAALTHDAYYTRATTTARPNNYIRAFAITFRGIRMVLYLNVYTPACVWVLKGKREIAGEYAKLRAFEIQILRA